MFATLLTRTARYAHCETIANARTRIFPFQLKQRYSSPRSHNNRGTSYPSATKGSATEDPLRWRKSTYHSGTINLLAGASCLLQTLFLSESIDVAQYLAYKQLTRAVRPTTDQTSNGMSFQMKDSATSSRAKAISSLCQQSSVSKFTPTSSTTSPSQTGEPLRIPLP